MPTKAQYEISSSVWIDEYTLQHHINQYLSNLLFSYDYYQKWNIEAHQFESTLPTMLTYPPFTSKNIKVKAVELDYEQRSFLLKWENFEVGQMSTLMKSSKKIYSTLLNYDNQGRLTHSVYRNYQHRPFREQIDYKISYSDTDSLKGLRAEVCWSEASILAKKHTSVHNYSFNNYQMLMRVNVTHQSRQTNGTSSFENNYSYDSLGRLTSAVRIPSSKVYRDRHYSYTITPFVLDSEQLHYQTLRIPGIQHWLRSYPDSSLSILAYQRFESNMNKDYEYSYLVDAEQNRLMMLRPYPHYFNKYIDSNSIVRSYCGISRNQNLNDTIPFDPNFKRRYIGRFYSQCSIEERYTTPHGLVNASSVEGYKRSEHQLPNGWKRITFQRGSSAPSRFAPGYPASVRLDIRFDKHLILDPSGVVRYIVDYDKLIQIDIIDID